MDEYFGALIGLIDLSQNKPINQIVYEGLRTAIIKGIIPVGERINEKEYSLRMNISRTPIREALRRIEEEGLVEYIPRYGTVVKKVTKSDVEEIFKIRLVLEILAATNAMHVMTEEQFVEMESLLEKTAEINRSGDFKRVIGLSGEFNSMVFRFSQMPRLESILTKLKDYLTRFRDISLYDPERRIQALEEHVYIYQCMRGQNEELVGTVIKEHLERSRDFIIHQLEQIENGDAFEQVQHDAGN